MIVPDKATLDRVFETVDKHREELLDELQVLCRQPSIAAQGVGMSEAAEMTMRLMRDAGLKTEMIDTGGYPVVFGELDVGAPRTLLFYNHYDV